MVSLQIDDIDIYIYFAIHTYFSFGNYPNLWINLTNPPKRKYQYEAH